MSYTSLRMDTWLDAMEDALDYDPNLAFPKPELESEDEEEELIRQLDISTHYLTMNISNLVGSSSHIAQVFAKYIAKPLKISIDQ